MLSENIDIKPENVKRGYNNARAEINYDSLNVAKYLSLLIYNSFMWWIFKVELIFNENESVILKNILFNNTNFL